MKYHRNEPTLYSNDCVGIVFKPLLSTIQGHSGPWPSGITFYTVSKQYARAACVPVPLVEVGALAARTCRAYFSGTHNFHRPRKETLPGYQRINAYAGSIDTAAVGWRQRIVQACFIISLFTPGPTTKTDTLTGIQRQEIVNPLRMAGLRFLGKAN